MKHFRRILAILLTFALLFSALPAAFASEQDREFTQADYDRLDADIWKDINALEDRAIRPYRDTAPTANEFAALTDDVAELVLASDTYQSGTLIRRGGCLFWQTDSGIACGYSPDLRARMHSDVAKKNLPGETVTTSYAVKGGSPDAVNVAVFQPYYGLDESFTTQYSDEGKRIAKATGGTSTTYLRENATVDAIANAFETCALVIFDSHGGTDYYDTTLDMYSGEYANTSYLNLQSAEGLTAADMQPVEGPFGTYYHALYDGYFGDVHYHGVDGTVIANHMDQTAPHNMLWSAICLGMATDGLHAPLREKGVEVAYGYSQSVTFDYDYRWEKTFFNKMIDGATVAEAVAAMKQAVGNWDMLDYYSTIEQAVRNHCAFPIVVSGEDAYPGQGKVDALQTVNSTWTLFSLCAHDGSKTTTSQDATCTEPGWTKVVCDLCGETLEYTETAALGHEYHEWIPDNQGNHSMTCSRCGAAATEPCTFTPVITPPSEFAGGFTSYVCDFCGYHYEADPTDPLGCQHRDVQAVAQTAPTCVQDGNLAYWYCPTCKTCFTDETLEHETDLDAVKLPALGHEWDDGVVTTKSTAWAEGVKTYTCTRCAMTKTEPIPTVPCAGGADCPAHTLTDVPAAGNWAHVGIDYAIANGLMNGMEGNTFQPQTTMTRGMLVTVLWRYAGSPNEGSNVFSDVPGNKYYTNAVAWAAKNGIVNGVGNGKFDPDGDVTREQMVTILQRYCSSVGADTASSAALTAFSDAGEVSSYARSAMGWAVAEGIVNGSNGKLLPADSTTRAEVAAILMRCIENVLK